MVDIATLSRTELLKKLKVEDLMTHSKSQRLIMMI